MSPSSPTAVARHLSFIRETLGANRGYWVQWMQGQFGGVPGDSWCAYFVSWVLQVAYLRKPPLKGTGSTHDMLHEAREKGYVLKDNQFPQADDLYFFVHDDGTPHHVGIVTRTGAPLMGIAGNTSEDGSSSNGTGVFEHNILGGTRTVFVRLPKDV